MPRKKTFEDKMERLDQVVRALEAGDMPLDKGVALYKEGLDLARQCQEELANARHSVKQADTGEDFPLVADMQD